MAAIGVDIGTSGVRACLINTSGQQIALAQRSLPQLPIDTEGRHEQNPQDWLNAAIGTLRELTSHNEQITDIVVDGTSGTLVIGDADASQAWMYDDQRAAEQAEQIAAVAPPGHPAASTSSSLAKAIYARQHGFTENLRHPAEWLAICMGADPNHCDENNALKLGYDPVARRWPNWLDSLSGTPRPNIALPGSIVGHVNDAFSQISGLPISCQIRAGTTDSTASALAAGPLQAGTGITVLGSTLVLKTVSETPVFDAASGVYSHRVGKYWLVGGASNSGGRVLSQFFSNQELKDLSRLIDPETDSGLNYYPLPGRGERFPINDPALAPRITPIPDDRQLFLHGLLEGITRIERLGYQKLSELGATKLNNIISIGGGAQNDTWTKLRRKLLNKPIAMAQCNDACVGVVRLLPSNQAMEKQM